MVKGDRSATTQTAEVTGLPTGQPGAGLALEEVTLQLAQRAAMPENVGLKDLLIGLHAKTVGPEGSPTALGKSTIIVRLVNGRVQKMKIRVVDIAERVYFTNEEMDGTETEE